MAGAAILPSSPYVMYGVGRKAHFWPYRPGPSNCTFRERMEHPILPSGALSSHRTHANASLRRSKHFIDGWWDCWLACLLLVLAAFWEPRILEQPPFDPRAQDLTLAAGRGGTSAMREWVQCSFLREQIGAQCACFIPEKKVARFLL